MNKSKINELSAGTEADSNSTAQNQHVSQPNANTNVVGIPFKSREIKFRAWGRYGNWNDEDNRNWIMIDGDSLCFETFAPICDLLESKEGEEYFMQYTGLKDKNGKEIYEGDILRTETDKPMVVGWSNKFASFVLERDGWAFQHWFGEAADPEYCEIIGNIFENPELLETLR